jgi:hypothetical protein
MHLFEFPSYSEMMNLMLTMFDFCLQEKEPPFVPEWRDASLRDAFERKFQEVPLRGEFHDQADAKWIGIKVPLIKGS